MYTHKPIKILKQNFDHPYGICYNEWNHHIIVSDYKHPCIKLFDSNTYQYSSSIVELQGNLPTGLCIQPFTHYVLICDENHRIQVLSNDDYSLLYQIGSTRSEDKGQFSNHRGICCDEKGHILVADTWNDRIQEFNESGKFLHLFGSYGQSLNQFSNPMDICFDKKYKQLLVADGDNKRVSLWSHDSSSKPMCISHIQFKDYCRSVCVDPLRNHQIVIGTWYNILVYDSRNHKQPIQTLGTSEFNRVSGICVNEQDGTLLVCDCNNNRIQLF